MVVLYYLVSIVSFVTAAPNTICVWDSTGDEWDRFNGEYAKQSTTYNGYAWYQQSTANSNCPTSSSTKIYASKYGNDAYWQAMITQTADWQPYYPDCENPNIENPTLCDANNWILYDVDENVIGSVSWTITGTTCPTLPCGRIQVTLSGNSNCNQIFTKDFSQDYVYTYGTRYLYFNPWTFKWYCSNTDGHKDCADDASITHQIWSSSSDGWTSTTIGQSFNVPVTTGSTAKFECLDTLAPTTNPTPKPTLNPTSNPTRAPTLNPTNVPTDSPTNPTNNPTAVPTDSTTYPTISPTQAPSSSPTNAPTTNPSLAPSFSPIDAPSKAPSLAPSFSPVDAPTNAPSLIPTLAPTTAPTPNPTSSPTNAPSKTPTAPPTNSPSQTPSNAPSRAPTAPPTITPSNDPTMSPSHIPTSPSEKPTTFPTNFGDTRYPSKTPTTDPTLQPSTYPTQYPSHQPSLSPTSIPSQTPTRFPTMEPTMSPTQYPSYNPSVSPSAIPSETPTSYPSTQPSVSPTAIPSIPPTDIPTMAPSDDPTMRPSHIPTSASEMPTTTPTQVTSTPTKYPSFSPSFPTLNPSEIPTFAPVTSDPSISPSQTPSIIRTTSDNRINKDSIIQMIAGNGDPLWTLIVIIGGAVLVIICIGAAISVYIRKTVERKVELALRVSSVLKGDHIIDIKSRSSNRKMRAYADKTHRIQSVASMSANVNPPSGVIPCDEEDVARGHQVVLSQSVHSPVSPVSVQRVSSKVGLDAPEDTDENDEDIEPEEEEASVKAASNTDDFILNYLCAFDTPGDEDDPFDGIKLYDSGIGAVFDDVKDAEEAKPKPQPVQSRWVMMDEFKEAVRRGSEYDHKPYKSAGIDAIKDNVVRRMSNKFNQELVQDDSGKEDNGSDDGSMERQLGQINENEADNYNPDELNQRKPRLRDDETDDYFEHQQRDSIDISEIGNDESMVVSLSKDTNPMDVRMPAKLGIVRQSTESFHNRLSNQVIGSSYIMDCVLNEIGTED